MQRNVHKHQAYYTALLRKCTGNLMETKKVHNEIASKGHNNTTFISNMIVQAYGKCGSVEEAWNVFSSIKSPNVFSWNMIIAAYAQNGHIQKSLSLFWAMVRNGNLQPSRVTFMHALTGVTDIEEGRKIHEQAIKCQVGTDPILETALLDMYGRCGSVREARKLFDSMQKRDIVAWTAMITAYAHNGHFVDAIDLYKRIDSDGVPPNMYTFSIVVDACTELGWVQDGIDVHARIAACGLESSVVVCNSLINMYGNFGRLSEAERLFGMLSRKSSISWNSMIAAYAHNGHPQKAIDVYRSMRMQAATFDPVTLVNVLGACSDFTTGRAIHDDAACSGFESHTVLSSALVTMYGRCGRMQEARDVFDGMIRKDQAAWNAIIAAYAQNGRGTEAMLLYRWMCCDSVRPTQATFVSVLEACADAIQGERIHTQIVEYGLENSTMVLTAVVNMYSRCGSLENARAAFDTLRVKNNVSWVNMINVYARHGRGREALDVFHEMRLEGFPPSSVLYISVLHACSHVGRLKEGLQYFVSMVEDDWISPGVEHYGCMIDLLGRNGHVRLSEDLVECMPFEPDARAWSSFLGSCRLHSDEQRAEAAAERVFELEPTRSACYIALSGVYATNQTCESLEVKQATP